MTVDGILARVAAGTAGLALLGIGVHLVGGAPQHVLAPAAPEAQPPAAATMQIETTGLQFDGIPGATGPAADVISQSVLWSQLSPTEPFAANDLLIDGAESAASAASPLSSAGSSLASSLPMAGAMAAVGFGQKAVLQLPPMLDSLPAADPLPVAADVFPAIESPF